MEFVFFLLNILKWINDFSSKLKLLAMVYFVGVINTILVSIFDEKFLICFKIFNKNDKIVSIFKKS